MSDYFKCKQLKPAINENKCIEKWGALTVASKALAENVKEYAFKV